MTAKLQSRNCLLSELAGTTWITSALALCYSEYCTAIWARFSYIKLVNSQLINSMQVMSGTL